MLVCAHTLNALVKQCAFMKLSTVRCLKESKQKLTDGTDQKASNMHKQERKCDVIQSLESFATMLNLVAFIIYKWD